MPFFNFSVCMVARQSVKVELCGGQADHTEGMAENPMYSFIPVDRYGDNKESSKPLEDQGVCVCIIIGKDIICKSVTNMSNKKGMVYLTCGLCGCRPVPIRFNQVDPV